MKRILRQVGLAWLVAGLGLTSTSDAGLHHHLAVRLDPAGHSLQVVDRLELGGAVEPDTSGGFLFVLHAGLEPEVLGPGWRLEQVEGEVAAAFVGLNASTDTASSVPLEGWRLLPGDGASEPVEIRYGGVVHHPLANSGEEYQRSFSETPGIIEERGVFLAGASFWVPTFGDQLFSFELEVSGLEPPWDVVSQGRRLRHELDTESSRTTAWRLDQPTEELYLVAGPWHSWADRAGEVDVLVFLRDDDPGLALRYLEATKRYLKLYEGMLPAFPYRSFALVENFWETGYGMPGFTLLGPRVIRFPWILTSSYPHELLHNWWGNSAYVDYERGNWCEGLTAYMADHLFAEQRGEGATYRRATLKKYSDFVSSGSDFPLTDFRSRRSAASEAVGYGKSLMLFHMLRRAVGDASFLEALSFFFEGNRFERSSFEELAAAFSASAGGDWEAFLEAWTTRTGAPRLEIIAAEARPQPDGVSPWLLRLHLRQTQEGEPFPITVPVAVTVAGRDLPLWVESGSCHRDCAVEIPCPGRPLRIDVDPAFDVMRRLDPLEVPPALSTLFGAADPSFVLPSQAPEEELAAWRDLAAKWAEPSEPRIVMDSDIEELPGGSLWLLGRGNRFAGAVVGGLAAHGVSMADDAYRVADDELPRHDHSLVLVSRAVADPASAVGWVAADPAAAIPGLARKLPHYTRYSYLGFRGEEPENVAKGMWQPLASPLVRKLSEGEMPALVLPSRQPLAELPPAFDAEALRRTVEVLADLELEGRGLGSEGLTKATEWVEARFAEVGLEPAGGDGFRQSWSWLGGEPPQEMELSNLLARVPGADPALSDRPVVVLAHLDHLGRGWPDVRTGNQGQVHPGADDNASGVAVLLELARTMAAEPPRPRPVLFAVVTAEEAGRIGSQHMMDELEDATVPFACVNLDSVGRLADSDTLYVLNADTAREWRFIFMGVGYTTGAPVEVVAEPLDSSDQISCIEHGVPAVQLFTGPHADYHRPSDTAGRIDADGMAVVAEAVHETLAYLAERSEPLTVTIGAAAGSGPPPAGVGGRRASLGTMPDFGFEGPGVRVQQVMPGSAAETAGIVAGDVVFAVDGEPVTDLRGYSGLLKTHAPGDEVRVTLRRDGEELIVTATLGAR